MSKTIFVITDGEYSYYGILGTALTREDAETFVKKFGGYIDEYPDGGELVRKGCSVYFVDMTRDGTAQSVKEGTDCPGFSCHDFYVPYGTKDDPLFRTTCWAKSPTHAIKIANERRVQIIAAELWNKDISNFSWAS